MQISELPHLNATLNLSSALMLLGAFVSIKQRLVRVHATLMIAATVTSCAFLAGYLIYHVHVGETRVAEKFPYLSHEMRGIYYAILFPHLVLAVVMVPMIFTTLWRALQRRWEAHRRIAPRTFFIWLYVSVTGVIIYWMLYHLFPMMKP
jgi:putative membrane protein